MKDDQMREDQMKDEQIKEDRKKAERAKIEQKIEARKKEKEELHEELLVGKQELKKAFAETIDPNGDKKISLQEIFGEMFSIKKDVADKAQIREMLWAMGCVSTMEKASTNVKYRKFTSG